MNPFFGDKAIHSLNPPTLFAIIIAQ